MQMKTIEERAKLNLMYEKDFCGNSLSDDMVYRAYVRGAIEQKETDIKNICEAYKGELQSLIRLLDESVGVPANLMIVDKSLSRIALEALFRKAMEE